MARSYCPQEEEHDILFQATFKGTPIKYSRIFRHGDSKMLWGYYSPDDEEESKLGPFPPAKMMVVNLPPSTAYERLVNEMQNEMCIDFKDKTTFINDLKRDNPYAARDLRYKLFKLMVGDVEFLWELPGGKTGSTVVKKNDDEGLRRGLRMLVARGRRDVLQIKFETVGLLEVN